MEEEGGNILVTGFGPFGEHSINASWEAVKSLPETIEKFKIIKEEVPVIYSHVESKVPIFWKNYKPKLVIHVGVSSYTNKPLIETCANKSGYTRLDCNNLNYKKCQEGEEIIRTSINAQEICEEINKNQNVFEIGTSCSAGRYLCEFIYYTSLNIDKTRCLFIHVPPLEKPYSVEILRDALVQIIKSALKQIKD